MSQRDGPTSAAIAPDPADRGEAGPLARAVVSAGIAVLLGASALLHIPGSQLARDLGPKGAAVLNAVGLEMNWVLFAPNPPDRTTEIVGRLTFADGTTDEWAPPAIEPWIGTYSQYRWGKLTEFAASTSSDWAAAQLADSIARREADERGVAVERIELVVRTHPPASTGDDRWTEEIVIVRMPGAGS